MLEKEINRILSLIQSTSSLFAVLIGVLVLLIFLYFFWGAFDYIRSAEQQTLKEIKDKLLWGILGITVVVSVWGLVYFFEKSIIGDHKGTIEVEFLQVN